MKFLNFKNSVEEFKYSYGLGEKAKSAAKILGIATINTTIFAGKLLVDVGKKAEEQKDRMEKPKR